MPRYRNLDPDRRPHGLTAVFRWGVWQRYVRPRPIAAPGRPARRVEPDLELIRRRGGPPRVTWIGHAAFLGTLGGRHFLVDPVFSSRVGWLVRRFGSPGLAPAQLPPLDALLVTHNHYDHLDGPSVRRLARSVPVFVPRGLGAVFRRWRFERVTELEWWESASAGPLEITLVPACHWSRRRIGDTNRTLWGGFVVESSGAALYHCGDSGWFDGFAEIGRRFPQLLAALLPVGAYAPAWFMENQHMNPEQAGRAFLRLGAKHMVPMHWGTFKLTDESLTEPVERVRRWWRDHVFDDARRLHVPAVGQTLVFDDEERA
jgi:L-ascorbate metabolism protein UlaG (beta-lactamase superfamily)